MKKSISFSFSCFSLLKFRVWMTTFLIIFLRHCCLTTEDNSGRTHFFNCWNLWFFYFYKLFTFSFSLDLFFLFKLLRLLLLVETKTFSSFNINLKQNFNQSIISKEFFLNILNNHQKRVFIFIFFFIFCAIKWNFEWIYE